MVSSLVLVLAVLFGDVQPKEDNGPVLLLV